MKKLSDERKSNAENFSRRKDKLLEKVGRKKYDGEVKLIRKR